MEHVLQGGRRQQCLLVTPDVGGIISDNIPLESNGVAEADCEGKQTRATDSRFTADSKKSVAAENWRRDRRPTGAGDPARVDLVAVPHREAERTGLCDGEAVHATDAFQ